MKMPESTADNIRHVYEARKEPHMLSKENQRSLDLAIAATAGPWHFNGFYVNHAKFRQVIVQSFRTQEDSAFIADARTAVPRMAAELEALTTVWHEMGHHIQVTEEKLNATTLLCDEAIAEAKRLLGDLRIAREALVAAQSWFTHPNLDHIDKASDVVEAALLRIDASKEK